MNAGTVAVFLLAFVGLTFEGLANERVALVIGNAAYANAPLRNPVNDARAMATRLSELGFAVTKLENASKGDIEDAIVRFEGQLGPTKTGLFYYAGHGIQVRGKNYLVPVDANIASERRARVEAVDVGLVTSAMEYARSRVNFIILDACRNNPFERRLRGQGRGLAAVDAASGTLIAYATAPGSVAEDGDGRNGMYTDALLKALRRPGMTAEAVFKDVRVAVAERTGRRQIPWESSSLTGEFVFNTAAPAAPPASGSPQRRDGNLEATFWESVRDSGSPAMVNEYLERFPDGTFAGLAKLKLSELEGARSRPRTSAPGGGAACPSIAGVWTVSAPTAACGEAVVVFTEQRPGELESKQFGCGDVAGAVRQKGNHVAIDWAMAFCSGHTSFTLDASCGIGVGEVVMPANFLACAGRHAITFRRVPNDSPMAHSYLSRRAGDDR